MLEWRIWRTSSGWAIPRSIGMGRRSGNFSKKKESFGVCYGDWIPADYEVRLFFFIRFGGMAHFYILWVAYVQLVLFLDERLEGTPLAMQRLFF